MQVQRTIDELTGIVRTTITGEISFRDIHADIKRFVDDPSFSPPTRGLVDLRQATSIMSTDEMLALTELLKTNPRGVEGARRAVLVNSELMFGLYRMFESFAAGGNVHYRAFRDEEDAWNWLKSL